LAEDQKRLEDQISAAARALEATHASSKELTAGIESSSEKINEALEALRKTVGDIVDNDSKRDAEIRGIKEEIEGVRSMLPKVR
jgi:peroxin-14